MRDDVIGTIATAKEGAGNEIFFYFQEMEHEKVDYLNIQNWLPSLWKKHRDFFPAERNS
jgi:hypothetical protein